MIAEVLPNLLKQTRRKIAEISGDGAYDTKGCYKAIRIKQVVALIPPRDGAAFWERGHTRKILVWPARSCMDQINTGNRGMVTTSALSQKRRCIG